MSFCIFAEVELLAAITTFELFSSFFHGTHLFGSISLGSRNRCAIHAAGSDRVSRRSMYHFRESNPPEVIHIQNLPDSGARSGRHVAKRPAKY